MRRIDISAQVRAATTRDRLPQKLPISTSPGPATMASTPAVANATDRIRPGVKASCRISRAKTTMKAGVAAVMMEPI